VGPGTYKPQVEVQVIETVRANILKPDQALKVQAREDCVDYEGTKRKAGEEWLIRKEGAYLPQVHEKVIETLKAYILTDKKALHVRAKTTFKTDDGSDRKAGSEWLVTNQVTESFIPGVYEEVVREVDLIVLTKSTYCVIKDPVDKNGRPQLGTRTLVKGEKSFFLQPGESLDHDKVDGSIRKAIILAPYEGIWLTATEEFFENQDGKHVKRKPGDVWLFTGPGQYWLPMEARVQQRIRAFLKLDALKLYFFQPGLFFGMLVAVLILLYFFSRMLFASSSPAVKGDL